MLVLTVILSLSLNAQKAPDFKTSLTEVLNKGDELRTASKDYTPEYLTAIYKGDVSVPVVLEKQVNFERASLNFLHTFYPKGFDMNDFLNRTKDEAFSGCKVACAGAYQNCLNQCGGNSTCLAWCGTLYSGCVAGCQTLN